MTPKKAYDDQKRHAADRDIVWNFTYEEWLELWLLSGKWGSRGREPNQFCMCRTGDTGPYSPRNCFIVTNEENQRQRWSGKEKITNKLANEISDLYLTTDLTQAQVAKVYDVDQSYVSRIINKKRKRLA